LDIFRTDKVISILYLELLHQLLDPIYHGLYVLYGWLQIRIHVECMGHPRIDFQSYIYAGSTKLAVSFKYTVLIRAYPQALSASAYARPSSLRGSIPATWITTVAIGRLDK
jgi:hypothetical protein